MRRMSGFRRQSSPARSNLGEQLGTVGGVSLHPGDIAAVHLLNVLPPKGVQVELVPQLAVGKDLVVLMETFKVTFDKFHVLRRNALELTLAALSSSDDDIGIPIYFKKVPPPEVTVFRPADSDPLGKLHQPTELLKENS